MRKPYAQWTTKERDALKRLILDGKNYSQVAYILGRPRSSVRSRALAWGYSQQKWSAGCVTAVEYPTARVPKQLVIDWYEIGWRVLGIGATDCVMEWRLSRAPEYPHACKVDVSSAPDRVLEVA